MITKLSRCNIELDIYDIICRIQDEDDLQDFIGILKEQLNSWGDVKLKVTVKHLIGLVK
ncbi:MAG: hypothetical protein MUO82_11985 [Candidatus Thermoplasmatota archaeon]|nr:hypothetical protein [Candidatus Thermoplasmatota archaeon]